MLTRLAAHMDDAQRATLEASLTSIALQPGETLFREGATLEALHVVGEGAIELSIDVDGQPVVLGRVMPGSFFGALNVLDGGVAFANAIAREPTTVLRLPRASFAQLRAKHPVVASLLLRALVEDLAERVRDANTVTVDEAPKKQGWFASALGALFGGR
jgi:CRP-like cAMP-binding protein